MKVIHVTLIITSTLQIVISRPSIPASRGTEATSKLRGRYLLPRVHWVPSIYTPPKLHLYIYQVWRYLTRGSRSFFACWSVQHDKSDHTFLNRFHVRIGKKKAYVRRRHKKNRFLCSFLDGLVSVDGLDFTRKTGPPRPV